MQGEESAGKQGRRSLRSTSVALVRSNIRWRGWEHLWKNLGVGSNMFRADRHCVNVSSYRLHNRSAGKKMPRYIDCEGFVDAAVCQTEHPNMANVLACASRYKMSRNSPTPKISTPDTFQHRKKNKKQDSRWDIDEGGTRTLIDISRYSGDDQCWICAYHEDCSTSSWKYPFRHSLHCLKLAP